MIKQALLVMTSVLWSLPTQASDIEDASVHTEAVSFFEQVGKAAISIPTELPKHTPESLGLLKSNPNSAYLDTFHITPVHNEQHWTNSNNSKSIWVKSQSINIEQPLVSALPEETTPRIDAGFHIGRFSAQTSVVSTNENFDNNSYFLQGSFALISKEQFNLKVTARLTTIDDSIVYSYYGVEHSMSFGTSIEPKSATNTSLGIIGTYNLTPRWKLVGAITSTNVDSQIEASPLINNNYMHMAQFGTSFSF